MHALQLGGMMTTHHNTRAGQERTRVRAIVRDPAILDGRWHFEGTTTAVADVRADYYAARDDHPTTPYHYAGLSAAEVVAALDFEFPNVRETTVEVEYASLTVHCTCGEDTSSTGIWPIAAVVPCPCRRTWRITVEPEIAAPV